MKRAINAVILTAGLVIGTSASAMDYLNFAQTELLKCVHPTTNLEKAKAEIAQEAATEGDVETARVRVFYKGWVKSNSVLFEIKNRKCGSINEVRAEVLEDTGSGKSPVCKYLDGWQDL